MATTEAPVEFVYHTEVGLFSTMKDLSQVPPENQAVHFRFFHFSEAGSALMARILDRYLLLLDIIFVRDSVYSALRETISNSIKANIKRIYFKNENADIANPADYQKKMAGFKKYYLEKKDSFEDTLRASPYRVTVSFIHDKNLVRIRVLNNVPLSADEKRRVQDRILKAQQYQDLSEAFMEKGDESEGAGLGLIMTLMMLKNDGLGDKAYRLEDRADQTTFFIDVPRQAARKEGSHVKKTEEILKQIDQLPTFPKTIDDIQLTIDKPSSSMNQIAEMVKKDIGLSGNILKLSNSAAFRRGNPVETLDRAIQLIGLKELRDLLYSLGTKQVMEKKFPAYQAIWEKSNQAAYYCKQIGMRLALPKDKVSNLVSAALLHDVGEIILLSLEKEKMKRIQSYANSKEIASSLSMEEAAFGITHTRIGALVAEKWKFPEAYAKAIEYHHRPLAVEEPFREIVFPIYLADMMMKVQAGEARFSEIHGEVLRYAKLASAEEFQAFLAKSSSGFKAAEK